MTTPHISEQFQRIITRQQNQIQALGLTLRIAILAITDLAEQGNLQPDQLELLHGQITALESIRTKTPWA